MYLGLMDIYKVINISTKLQFIGIKNGEIKSSFVKVTRTANTLSIVNINSSQWELTLFILSVVALITCSEHGQCMIKECKAELGQKLG